MIKFNTQWFSAFIILVLVILLVIQRSCTKPVVNDRPIVITTTDTLWLKKKDSIVYRPSKYITIPADTAYILKKHLTKVDTIAILRSFFAKNVYLDSIKLDSLGYAFVTDTITQNTIASRKVKLDYKIPVITKTTTITNPPLRTTQLYIGPEIAGNATYPVNYFGGNVILKTKQDQMYNAGVGISNGGTTFKIGMAWKIKIK